MPTDPKVTPPMSAAHRFWYVNMERYGSVMDTGTLDFANALAAHVAAPLEAEIAALKLELKKWAQVERLDPAGCITGLTKRAEAAEAENTALKACVAAWEQWRDLEKVRNATALAGVRAENTALKARVVELEKALQDIGKLTCSCSDRWKPGIHYSYCAPAMARAVLAGKGSQ